MFIYEGWCEGYLNSCKGHAKTSHWPPCGAATTQALQQFPTKTPIETLSARERGINPPKEPQTDTPTAPRPHPRLRDVGKGYFKESLTIECISILGGLNDFITFLRVSRVRMKVSMTLFGYTGLSRADQMRVDRDRTIVDTAGLRSGMMTDRRDAKLN